MTVPVTLFDGFQADIAPQKEVVDELETNMIAGYRRARERGLEANNALAAILTWAAGECERLQREIEAA